MLWNYEFHQFDTDTNDMISAFDFAKSLFVYYLPFHKIPEYMEHLEQFKEYKMRCCDVDQYCAFQYFLKTKARIIEVVLEKDKLDFPTLRELVDEFQTTSPYVEKHSVKINDEMLKAFLIGMDIDGNGALEAENVTSILMKRKKIGS